MVGQLEPLYELLRPKSELEGCGEVIRIFNEVDITLLEIIMTGI